MNKKILLIFSIFAFCACNSTDSDISNNGGNQEQYILQRKVSYIEDLPAAIYYDKEVSNEYKERYPYTYMRNKYMDIALDYMGVWSSELIKLDLSEKEKIFEEVSENVLNSDKEYIDLGSSDEDAFFAKLYEQMAMELNSFPIIQKYLSVPVSQEFDELDIILPFDGGIAYSKFEILQCVENDMPLEHEKYNTTDYYEEVVDCDCKEDIDEKSKSQYNDPQRVVKYNLVSKWKKEIRYRNYKKSCPDIEVMHKAMNEWEEAANYAISFREINDNGWNRFSWGIGCNYHVCISDNMIGSAGGVSSCGAVPWAYVHINKTSEELYKNSLHELGHTLGLKHEQCRPDRDCYIDVHFENIPANWKYQYRKYTTTEATSYGEFDYNSIMLYGSYLDLDKSILVMTKKDGSTFEGEGEALSEKDKLYIRKIYY